MYKPHVAMLCEDNVRTGFFEPDQLAAVLRHLPADTKPIVRFGAITGWRVSAEVLPLQWKNVDLKAGEVRLGPRQPPRTARGEPSRSLQNSEHFSTGNRSNTTS